MMKLMPTRLIIVSLAVLIGCNSQPPATKPTPNPRATASERQQGDQADTSQPSTAPERTAEVVSVIAPANADTARPEPNPDLEALDRLTEINAAVQQNDDGQIVAVKLPSGSSDADLNHLQGLSELRELNLSWTDVTNDGLKALSNHPKLEQLDLSWTAIDDGALESLSQFTALKLLVIGGTELTDNGIAELRGALNEARIQADSDSPIAGQIEENKAPTADTLDKVQAEYQSRQQAFYERIRNSSEEEREQLLRERPDANDFAQRAITLARRQVDSSDALAALLWIVRDLSGRGMDDVQTAASRLIVEHHIGREELGQLALRLMYAQSEAAEALLWEVKQNSPHHPVRGQATYSLARMLKGKTSAIPMLRALPEDELAQFKRMQGEEVVNSLLKSDPVELQNQAIQLLQEVVDQFGDVPGFRKNLGDMATGDLFELRHLAIGCEAPDIEGEDIDGVEFKLSDYRGKVVMLDFWGHW